MKYMIPSNLLAERVRVHVIGAGGSGSHVVNGLVQLHTAMVALGHPGGLRVTLVDDDTVSESNVGRQAFVWSDIGQPKAAVLINRLNQAFGLDWRAEVARLQQVTIRDHPHLVIGCVDNRTARACIARTYRAGTLWLDLGNRLDDGQVVLGEIGKTVSVAGGSRKRLPTIVDLYPEVADGTLDQSDELPSCSLAEALEKQGLFVNRAMALHGLNILWNLFRHGQIEHHGVFANLSTGRTSPLSVDPETWTRMGYPKARSARKKAA